MKRFAFALAMVVSLAFIQNASAQDDNIDNHTITIQIPEVALLDIETSASPNFNMGPVAPTEAGEPLDFSAATNSNLWLNYSSIKSSSDPTRSISVVLDVAVPSGNTLTVQAAAPTGIGGLGTSAATALTLSTTSQDIVSGITSCYTLDGSGNGVNLTYTLSQSGTANYADLEAASTPITVTYTLSDN